MGLAAQPGRHNFPGPQTAVSHHVYQTSGFLGLYYDPCSPIFNHQDVETCGI